MANPVVDTLAGTGSGGLSWQADVATTDANKPQNAENANVASTTSLPGELRSIKSNVRSFSLDPCWINYTGLSTAPSALPPTGTPGNTNFLLTGNWTTWIYVGQRVRMTYADASQGIATITEVALSITNTLVTLDSALQNTIAYVEFSALKDPTDGPDPLQLVLDGTTAVVPTTQGGTGVSAATPTALGLQLVAGGDLSGHLGDAVVVGLQGHSISDTAPSEVTTDQALAWTIGSPGSWGAQSLGLLLPGINSQIKVFENRAASAHLYLGFTLPLTIGTAGNPLQVKMMTYTTANIVPGVPDAYYAETPRQLWTTSGGTAFSNNVYAVFISYVCLFSGNVYAPANATWNDAHLAVDDRDKDGVQVNFFWPAYNRDLHEQYQALDIRITVLAIGD